jgi:hypothetical protein
MSIKARVILTVILGIVMGVSTWLSAEWSSPAEAGFACWVLIILIPLIVGRWWVLAALSGRLIALIALQLTGHMFESSDGFEPALSLLSIAGLVIFGFFMLILVGIRMAFDLWRDRGAIASP